MAPRRMRCHYDVLEVSRDASDGELKRAYRKLALEWHPDKNQHRHDEAEARFKEIRAAYETLSDPNERAWYDSHREAILRAGHEHAAGGEGSMPEDEINLMPYFSGAAFRGFDDQPGGFYETYRRVFDALDKQEQQASLAAGRDHFEAAPSFGRSDSDWDAVRAFYVHWSSYATQKTFAWADEYNLAEAQNRKVRRLMDEENKKLRRGEAREFNDTVRQLIAFVRKRDKRFIAHSAERAERASRHRGDVSNASAASVGRFHRVGSAGDFERGLFSGVADVGPIGGGLARGDGGGLGLGPIGRGPIGPPGGDVRSRGAAEALVSDGLVSDGFVSDASVAPPPPPPGIPPGFFARSAPGASGAEGALVGGVAPNPYARGAAERNRPERRRFDAIQGLAGLGNGMWSEEGAKWR